MPPPLGTVESDNEGSDGELTVAPNVEILNALRERDALLVAQDAQAIINQQQAELFPTAAVADQARWFVVMAEYLELIEQYHSKSETKHKTKEASGIACCYLGRDTKRFARTTRSQARYLVNYGRLPL